MNTAKILTVVVMSVLILSSAPQVALANAVGYCLAHGGGELHNTCSFAVMVSWRSSDSSAGCGTDGYGYQCAGRIGPGGKPVSQ